MKIIGKELFMNDVHPIGIKRDTDKYHGINTPDSEGNVPCSSQSEYTRVESNEGYKYPHRVNYPRHRHPSFAANIRYDFPPSFQFLPRFHSLHSSPSIRITSPLLPPCLCRIYSPRIARSSLHQHTHPTVASPPTYGRARHPSRSREDHRDASLRSYPTYANVVVVAVTIAAVALVVVGSSAARINRQGSADN